MKESVLIIVVQFVILAVLGLATLSVLSESTRDLLLPAAPIFGAALLATTMTTTSWFWSARWGLLATVLVAGGIVARAIQLGRRPWRVGWRPLGTAALVMLVNAPGLAAALIPAWIVTDNMAVMPNGSHDAYYYAAESTWLKDFPIRPGPLLADIPGEGTATPALGPMQQSLEFSVRIGQPLVHAALDVVMGTQSVQTVTPLGALWVLLVGPAAFVAARLFGARFLAALATATLSSSSALLIQQAYQQNMDSMLGASLAMLTIASVVVAMQTGSRRYHETAPDLAEPGLSMTAPSMLSGRRPRWWNRVVTLLPNTDALWPGVLMLAGLVAVYTEYALFVAPALVGALFIDRVRGFAARFASLGGIVLIALAITPTAWVRGLRTLLASRPVDTFPSPFLNTGRLLVAARWLGVTNVGGNPGFGRIVGPGLVAVIGIGLVGGLTLAIVLNRGRGAWIGMLAVGLPYVALLTREGKGYTQYRTILLFTPLLILVAVLGWSELYPRLRTVLARAGQRRARVGWGVVVTATALAVVATATVNLRAMPGALDRGWVLRRHVDATYADALDWVIQHGGHEGAEVSVADPDIASQMWLAYYLRDQRLVSYPALRFDYLRKNTYWDGALDPYYIVGPGASYAGGEVVDKNGRFTLVHFGDRAGIVALPTDELQWNPHAAADGSMPGPDLAKVLVLASRVAPGQLVDLKVRTGAEGLPVAALIDGKEVAVATVAGGLADLKVDLDGRPSTVVQFDVGRDGAITGDIDFVGVGIVGVDPA